MNNLPAVLQNEIWEYVRGDRAFWKSQHKLVIEQIEKLIKVKERFAQECTREFAWHRRGLICFSVNRDVEHQDHLHENGCFWPFEQLQREPVEWRRKFIKNPKYHTEDLSFLINLSGKHGSTSTSITK
jgi:hypothetical protein